MFCTNPYYFKILPQCKTKYISTNAYIQGGYTIGNLLGSVFLRKVKNGLNH